MPRSRPLGAIALLTALVLVPGVASAVPGADASSRAFAGVARADDKPHSDGQGNKAGGKTTTRAEKMGSTYRVASGSTFTNPLNGSRSAIGSKLVRIINNAPRGSQIRLVSWNFDSPTYSGALTRAHNRGVTVRIIMARTLAQAQGPRGSYNVMRRNLARHNAQRPPGKRSWIRTCSNSCRGRGGAMHSKFYVFSRSGRSEKIVVNTSANLTGASRKVQWNDAYTTVGREKTYWAYMRVFREMTRDRKARYVQYKDGFITGFFHPRLGRRDMVVDMLNRVRCRGTSVGVKGRTAIRVAQDVFNNKRGLAIARKLKQLKRSGCFVRVTYSQAVGEIRPVIESLPHNHLVQDQDGDGTYDRYLHSKVMTISGNYNGKRNNWVAMNGSGNWSGTATISDEQGMVLNSRVVAQQYSRYIDSTFRIHLKSAPPDPEYSARLRTGIVPVDPYSEMES